MNNYRESRYVCDRDALHRVFARRLRAARERARLTQQAVADAVGVHEMVYRRWESRAVHFPRLATLAKLRAVLGCSVDGLLGLEDLPDTPPTTPAEPRGLHALRRRLRRATAAERDAVMCVLDLLGIEDDGEQEGA